jgi:hypothetical protein
MGADGNAVATENAMAVGNLGGKSIFIESQESGRANRHAYAVPLA